MLDGHNHSTVPAHADGQAGEKVRRATPIRRSRESRPTTAMPEQRALPLPFRFGRGEALACRDADPTITAHRCRGGTLAACAGPDKPAPPPSAGQVLANTSDIPVGPGRWRKVSS